jgi:hypothetical protein
MLLKEKLLVLCSIGLVAYFYGKCVRNGNFGACEPIGMPSAGITPQRHIQASSKAIKVAHSRQVQ